MSQRATRRLDVSLASATVDRRSPHLYGALLRAVTISPETSRCQAPFKERLHKGYAQSHGGDGKPLADEKSQFQRIRIFDTVANGRVMTLDDIVQITTRDESAYADMLTHLPMLEHGKVERVMIVGGGDLSIADEALKHKGVKEVVLVDIDGRVIELCREAFRRDQRQGVQGQAAENRSRRRLRISRPQNRRTVSISSSPTVPIRWARARRCSARPSMTASRAR